MRRSLMVLTLAAMVTLPAFADSNLQSARDEVVAAEHAFSKLSGEKGVKEAFHTYIADDGVLFRGGSWVQGKEWTATHPAPPIQLSWRPSHSDIARSGDMGWNVGPYEVRAPGSDEAGHGHFMTVWVKQPDGSWRFAIDHGIHHAKPEGESPAPGPVRPEKLQGEVPKASTPEAAAAQTSSLLEMDRALGKATAQGTVAAYAPRLADDVRLLRNGASPHVGAEAARAALEKGPSAMTSEPTAGGVSGAGDMGYTYGYAEWKDGEQPVKAAYVRIWEKRAGDWKLVADLLTPIPPPPPAPPAEAPAESGSGS